MKNKKLNIKKKSLLLSVFIFSIFNFQFSLAAYAATPTVTVKPKATESEKQEKLIEQINNLKEKVASKVAELRLVEKRGIIIVVKEISGNKITGEDINGKIRLIDVDELTKFSSPTSKSTFGISDITPGMTVSTIGLYNKQSKRILARFITVETEPEFITGVVQQVDKANFIVNVLSENGDIHNVDIENVTKTSIYAESDSIKRAGFSKIGVGNRVYIVGYPNKTKKTGVIASRFIIFSELPPNPKIKNPTVKPTIEEATPSSKSSITKTPTR